jgi:hypothetical protein
MLLILLGLVYPSLLINTNEIKRRTIEIFIFRSLKFIDYVSALTYFFFLMNFLSLIIFFCTHFTKSKSDFSLES